ncbi:MAG: redox protein regulator of disulfide bond formation [Rhodospirillaceae bacterium]|nr:MAG: redox protein regulator of disulfide bond formation [Rhodospirillaceae bacterium]
MTDKPDYYLDITRDLCPMTFVKTKLLVERMQPGQVCEIRLQGAEPLINVPRSIATLGDWRPENQNMVFIVFVSSRYCNYLLESAAG